MARAENYYKQSKRPFPKPGAAEYEQLKAQAITFLIQRAELQQEAEKLGDRDQSDDKVDKRLQELKKQFTAAASRATRRS